MKSKHMKTDFMVPEEFAKLNTAEQIPILELQISRYKFLIKDLQQRTRKMDAKLRRLKNANK